MKKNTEFDYLFKILIIGDSGVGKSCILERYIDNTSFTNSYISTIGVDFKIKNENVDNKKVKLQIWDTAGQERFRSIVSSYYRGTHGIIIVYDITDKNSFENIQYWLNEIKKNANDNISILIIGNKADLLHLREIKYNDALSFAKKYEINLIETSAKTTQNIDTAFIKIAEAILKNIENEKSLKNNDFMNRINIDNSKATTKMNNNIKNNNCSC